MNIILEIIFLYQMTVLLKGKTFLIGLIGYNCVQFCDNFLESFYPIERNELFSSLRERLRSLFKKK